MKTLHSRSAVSERRNFFGFAVLVAVLSLAVPSAALRAADSTKLTAALSNVVWAAAPDVSEKNAAATFTVDRAMQKGGEPLTLTLKGLQIGLYSLRIYGSVDPKGRTELDRVWKPCPMEFEAHDAQGKVIAIGRRLLKQSFTVRLMQDFDIHVNEPGDVTATFRIGDGAMETARIQKIVMIDQLAGLPDEAIKKEQNLAKGPSAQLKALTDARKKRDDNIWEALPPLNIHLQVHGASPAFAKPPAAANLPTWATKAFVGLLDYQHIGATFAGLDMINTKTHEVLTNDQVVQGVPWPGPHADDGTGIYLTQKEFPELKNDIYYSPRANLLGERTYLFLGILGTWDYNGASLPKKYLEKGDPNVGHDAAMALVRLAYDWPAVQMTFHELRLSTGAPDFEYNTDWSNPGRRDGKYFYEGWSGSTAVDLMTSYDHVFPYIKDNQVFADAVHRFIPWIKTPEDVVRFLDRWLVFASVRDFNKGLIRASPVQDIAAQVLGPCPQTAAWFDLTEQYAEIYPFKGNYADLYAVALSRSGCYYIGSLMYDFGDASETIQKAMALADARKKGVPLTMDLSNVEKYRKVKKAGDFLIDMFVGGGFPFMVGDASGGPHTGLVAANRLKSVADASRGAVALWGDKRHAWLLKNLDGDKDPAVAKLAEGVEDPILHNPSRVVPDYGAILELGVDETDTLKKTAATLRLGCGQGHAHSDYLDLNLFGLGLPLAVDLACRDEGGFWSRPGANWAFLHNHAIAHGTEDPKGAGAEGGEPWLTAFAPPLLRASYANSKGDVRLDRDVLLMEIGGAASGGLGAPSYYAFDVQRLKGDKLHTWCFHGCESQDVQLNVPMEDKTVRWVDRTLEGTHKVGAASAALQATWTMTREGKDYPYAFMGGGVIKTAACEPTVLGKLYDRLIPPLHVRATLLGHAGEQVLQGNPYSKVYDYCFPFLWVQAPAKGETIYPAIYEWYRGDKPTIAKAELLQNDPVRTVVKVTTSTGQEDTYTSTPDSFLAVSRDAKGLRWAKISGGATLEQTELTLKPGIAGYNTPITDIDYVKRTLTTKDPLPANTGATIGNNNRRIFLNLKGEGTALTFDDDLIVNDGPITDLKIVDANTISAKTTQNIFHEGDGNRKAAGFTAVTEDYSWQFRGGKVIRKPQGATLNRSVFNAPKGEGLGRLKTYEIGLGDSVDVPANITLRRTDAGYEVQTNVPVSGSLAGQAFALQPAEAVWQPVKGK